MARIGITLSGIERTLLNRLAEAQGGVANDTLRLATQKNINSPADNPATFVLLSAFQGRLNAVTAAMTNVTAAGSLIGQTRSNLDQMRTQLTTIRSELMKDESRSLSPTDRAESQATIDEAIKQINTLAGTSVDGRRTLDGSGDFQTSGRNPAQVTSLNVYSTGRSSGQTATISGSVTHAATQAELTYDGSGGQVAATFTLTGRRGAASITLAGGETLDQVATKINDVSHQTGVTATVSGNQLRMAGVDYGSRSQVSVSVASGSFVVHGGNGAGTSTGADAAVQLNGQTYDATAGASIDGNRVTVNQNGLQYQIEFAPHFTGSFQPIAVSGTALTFAVSTQPDATATIAIPGLFVSQLGGPSGRLSQILTGGPYSGLDGNTSRAIRIVDESLDQLDAVRGNVSGFYNAAIAGSSSLLTALQTDLNKAITQTDGFNKDQTTASLYHNEDLVSTASAGLIILSQQRSAMVDLIRQIAGLGTSSLG